MLDVAQNSGVRDWTKTTLRERLDEIQRREGGTQNEVARRAGVDSGVYSRLRQRGDTRFSGSVENLYAIARNLRYRFSWVAAGEGEPTEPTAPPSSTSGLHAHAVELDRFPHRVAAARIALEGGVDPAAVASVSADELNIHDDPPILWWIDRMRVRALVMRGADVHVVQHERPSAPPASAEMPSNRNRNKR